MARPKGTQEGLAARRESARMMNRAGKSISQIATELDCTEVAVRQWLNGPAEPPFPSEQLRVRVFARLNEERSAAVLTGGQYQSWTTEALPFAFGHSFADRFADEGVEPIPSFMFTNTLLDWDCYQDEQGVWRTPVSA